MAKDKSITATDILDAIEVLWPSPAWAWLREVSNSTGVSASRYADAVGVSTWPSRGIFARGIEVKISRHDWLSELKNPDKSAKVQAYCRDWYVATPPGIILAGELPETWGHVIVDKKAVVACEPKLRQEPKALDWNFAAALIRRAQESVDAARQRGEEKGRRETFEQLNGGEVEALKNELASIKVKIQMFEQAAKSSSDSLQALTTQIQEAGIPMEYRGMNYGTRLPEWLKSAIAIGRIFTDKRGLINDIEHTIRVLSMLRERIVDEQKSTEK